MRRSLAVGDHIYLSGGHSSEPPWLAGSGGYTGIVVSFIPGQNHKLAAVVQLDSPISAEGTTGSVVVLELRYVGARWKDSETVHVELCDSVPEAKEWQDRRQGQWVEANATYRTRKA